MDGSLGDGHVCGIRNVGLDIAVCAFYDEGGAVFAAGDGIFQLQVSAVKAPHEAHHGQVFAGSGLCLHDFAAAFSSNSQRLFAENVFACFDRGENMLLVQLARRGNHNGVDVICLHDFAVVIFHTCAAKRCGFFGRLASAGGDGCDLCTAHAAKSLDVIQCDVSGSDYSDSDSIHEKTS